ncbi:HK97-gp10 family putative phage morphogenesis protein [Tenacibaculum sp. nBUS_03]|uniref:HK97-gp10 family putative phage morphogenesis protein n=1 Tax=Tenacibaculum sp. nBUS_03 TaxID=3395320 RepID=UPI003EC05627
MSRGLFEVEGFDGLSSKLKKLGDDKTKRKPVERILMRLANPTLKLVKSKAPVSKTPHILKRKNQRFGTWVLPGTGKKSIGKKVMRKAKNPMVSISPRSTKRADGWYLRQFVIPGTKKIASNPFIDQALEQTKSGVTKDAEKRMSKFIEKEVKKLST